jgi:hypothetical protein
VAGPRIGGHFTGRIWGRQSPVPRTTHGDPRGLEVGASGLAPHAGAFSQAPKCRTSCPWWLPRCGHAGGWIIALPAALGVLSFISCGFHASVTFGGCRAV